MLRAERRARLQGAPLRRRGARRRGERRGLRTVLHVGVGGCAVRIALPNHGARRLHPFPSRHKVERQLRKTKKKHVRATAG